MKENAVGVQTFLRTHKRYVLKNYINSGPGLLYKYHKFNEYLVSLMNLF